MGKQPFSAPKPRSLPTSTPTQDINQTLANWQTQLNPFLQNAAPQATPLNFNVTNSRGGLSLSWSPVTGADGYEILKSVNGSFTDDLQIIPVKDANQSSYFDSLGGNAKTAYYRIRTTSGNASNPQSQRGPESGVVSHTSIDASDTQSVPITKSDVMTTDSTRANARKGNYGAIKPSPLGKAGGSSAGSGAKGGSGTNAGTPSSGATSFSVIGTGENRIANMTIGAGAFLGPSGSNPGTVAANRIQSIPVTPSAPSDTNGLQYNAANGDLEYAPTPQTITATTSRWLNSYSAVTGAFTATQPAASDLSNGTTGSGAVVLAGSPALTGVPTAPTATTGTNTTQLATTAFVQSAGATNTAAGQGGFFGRGQQVWDIRNGDLSANNGAFGTANQVIAQQFTNKVPTAINHATITVGSTTAPGSTIAVGIYDVTKTNLLVQANFSGSPSGVQSVSGASIVTGNGTILQPGVYWYAYACTSTTPTVTVEIAGNGGDSYVNAVVVRQGTAATAMSLGVLPPALGTITHVLKSPLLCFFEP